MNIFQRRLLFVAVLIITFGFNLLSASTASSLLGDLNGDGQRTLTDVRWCIEMLVGLRAKDLTTADLTGEGQLTLADLQALIRLLVGGGSVPPTITTPPANQTVPAGQTATFSVIAAGTTPLSYQWQNNGVTISGATSVTYTTPATTTADNGSTYRVIVSNAAGSVTSPAAILTVTTTSAATNNFSGSYFDNIDFTNLKVTRTDPAITFDWGSGSPDPALGADTFSIRWEGDWDFPSDGTYRFTAVADDGIRMWVDGVLLLDKWFDQAPTTYTVDQPVPAGRHRVKMEYYENGGGATAKFSWALQPTTFTINGPSGGDDVPAIQHAINSAVAAGHADVVLRAGTYRLNSYDAGWGSHLVLYNGNDVALRGYPGEAVMLLMGNLEKHGITANSTRDLRLENLTIDWSTHPFGQGTISSINTATKTVWVSNDSGYLTWDNPFFSAATATIYLTVSARDATPPQPYCGLMPDSNSDWGYLDRFWGYTNGLNWFKYRNLDSCITVGQKVVLVKNSWTSTALHLGFVKGALIKDVTIYAAPGLATLNEHSDRGTLYPQINFTNYRITYHPTDTSRTITTNADGIHSTGSRAAIFINNSLMKGMADDAMNLHTRGAYFVNRWLSGSQWIISFAPEGGWGDWRNGDRINIYNVATKTLHCSVIAQSDPYTASCGGYTCLNVSAPVNGTTCTGMTGYNGSNRELADRAVSMNQTFDYVGNQPSVIENNQILGHRGRAILNRMWNTVIRNNVFGTTTSHSSSTGIYEGWCADEPQGTEGALVTPSLNPGQVITGNTGYWGNAVGGCL